MQDFVHLHVHTYYSILDGQASIKKLVDKAIANGMRGMAVTDHGNMFGIKEFFNYCKKKNGELKEQGKPEFKPILGCEMYVARRTKEDKVKDMGDQSGYHLILLAKNLKGYHNLIKIVSKAWTDGFYMRPRTDRAEIEKYHEGLICCSACLAGEVPRAITAGDLEKAEESIRWHKRVFGDDYYLELQLHKATVERANHEAYPMQLEVNRHLRELSAKYGVRMVCTNDVHFVDEENAEAHDRLICLSTGKDLDDPKRMLYSKQEWLKTTAEMASIFGESDPEAMATTVDICNQIEFYSIDHAPIMPNFEIPKEFGTEEEYRARITEQELYDEFTRDEHGNVVMSEEEGRKKIEKLGGYDKLYRIKFEADYLAKLTMEGAHRRYGEHLTEEQQERLKFELHIMKTMGFPGYFLIVQDFIRAAREELDVSVGPGRGSAAGSAVAYCLGITQIDPIKYDLLFERFLNPDRISLPDIDVDFDDDGRNRVLNWVTQKYGEDNVAHIITYGTMATKLAIKDVARVQKLPRDISERLCKAIPDKLPEGPDGKVPKMNLTNAIIAIPELREAEASPDPLLHDTIRYAKMLEGNVRNTGVHACGFIICKDNISDWVPISTADDKETGQKVHCTQYEGRVIEETGLIKMDFLGLKTLSIIKEAIENIKDSLKIELDIDKISIEDPATYQLYCDGNTVGTFQFESAGMQKYLRELQPSTFEDLIAMNALYRPGPMQYIPQFIKRKHGEEPITYDLPCMEKYLKDTYGITVYQEQVMLLSRVIANFTRGESDALRKAMGKKLIEKLNHMYPKFIEGGKKNGYDPKVLEKIWEDWRAFASYAFNKSHATCYSWVAYQTAFLKANYPAQYMAAVMSRSRDDIKTITKLMDECKSMSIRTLGPDINESRLKFSVNTLGDIRFGMGAIKGVGENAVMAIIEEREKHGPYTSVYDFVERINLNACNKKVIINLALAGAFDSFKSVAREQFVAIDENTGENFVDTLVRYGQRFQQDKAVASASLFGSEANTIITKPAPVAQYTPWSDLERLNNERELIGIYISGHPLDDYAIILHKVCSVQMKDLEDLKPFNGQDITLGGIVSSVRQGQTRTGKPYGIVKIEDYSGTGEIPLFGEDWARWSGYMYAGSFLFISGRVEPHKWKGDSYELRIGNIEFLTDVKERKLNDLTISVRLDRLNDAVVNDLTAFLTSSPGPTSVQFKVYDLDHSYVSLVSKEFRISVKKPLIDYIETCDALEYEIN